MRGAAPVLVAGLHSRGCATRRAEQRIHDRGRQRRQDGADEPAARDAHPLADPVGVAVPVRVPSQRPSEQHAADRPPQRDLSQPIQQRLDELGPRQPLRTGLSRDLSKQRKRSHEGLLSASSVLGHPLTGVRDALTGQDAASLIDLVKRRGMS